MKYKGPSSYSSSVNEVLRTDGRTDGRTVRGNPICAPPTLNFFKVRALQVKDSNDPQYSLSRLLLILIFFVSFLFHIFILLCKAILDLPVIGLELNRDFFSLFYAHLKLFTTGVRVG